MHLSYQNLQKRLEEPAAACIGKSRYVLVEFDDDIPHETYFDAVFKMQLRGLAPILTHPERNRGFQNSPKKLDKLTEMGCAVQITANSLLGFWGSAAKKLA